MTDRGDERNELSWPRLAEGDAWPAPAEGSPPLGATERIAALEAALRALVVREPVVHNNQGVNICGVCGRREWRDAPFEHASDCAWRQAKALLGEGA